MSHSRSPIPSYHSPWTITSSTSDNPWYRSVRRSSNAGMQQSPPSPPHCEESQTPILPPIVKPVCTASHTKPTHTKSSSDPFSSSPTSASFFRRTFMKRLRPTPPPIQTTHQALANQDMDGWTEAECNACSPISPAPCGSSICNRRNSSRPDTPYYHSMNHEKISPCLSGLRCRRLILLPAFTQKNEHLQIPVVADEGCSNADSLSPKLSPLSISMNSISEEENKKTEESLCKTEEHEEKEEEDEDELSKEKNHSSACCGRSCISHNQQRSAMPLHSPRHSMMDIPNNLSAIAIHC